ncbi:hypothetical protein K4K57_010177 [Colletotrichum sp. SAR 10_99]|nr:hypothetical protein K4K57_010177 [Colletotrichum sp. SAR 10_99]
MPPTVSSRGRSFLQALQDSHGDEDEELRDVDKLMEELENQSEGFRPESQWTQYRQNKVLEQYETWVKWANKLPPAITQDELDQVAFPPPEDGDFTALFARVRRFLLFSAKTMTPRSNRHQHVSYPFIVQLGFTIVYWAKSKYKFRPGPELPVPVLRAKIAEVTRFAAATFKLMEGRTVKKSLLTYSEVTQLIDSDASTTPCIELAEGHHFAWLLARCCALRPGALGQTRKPPAFLNGPRYLIWNDVEIKRGQEPGEFDAKITIRNLKDSSFDRDAQGHIRSRMNGQTGSLMDFFFKSPKDQINLAFSPVHRLLVMALRRGALQDINTVEELLTGNASAIIFKPEFLQRPVILAGVPGGRSVSDQPVTPEALTDYISKRAKDAGYSSNITFYALRRSAARSLTQTYGADVARQIMCHAPESRLLESTYLELRQTLDLTAVGLSENHEQRKAEIDVDLNYNALSRIHPDIIKRVVHPAADAVYERLLATDTIFLSLRSPSDQKNRKRVLRRIALETARREVEAEQATKMTTEDVAQRKNNIVRMANSFSERLVSRAAASLAGEGHSPFGRVDSKDETDPDVNLAEPKTDEEPELDAEDNFAEGGQQVPEEMNYRVLTKEIPYAEAARHVLSMLLESQGSESKQLALTCDLCQADQTTSDSDKTKVWPDEKHLERHRNTKFHSGFATWSRRAKYQKEKDETDGLICEVCSQIIPEDAKIEQHASIKELQHHMDASDANHIEGNALWANTDLAKEHDALKLDLGWADPEFHGSRQLKTRNAADQARKRKQRQEDVSVVFLDLKPLEDGIEVPDLPGILLGGTTTIQHPMDSSFVNIAISDVDKTQASVQKDCGPGIRFIEPPNQDTINTSMSADIRDNLPPNAMLVPTPGTPGNKTYDDARLLNAMLNTSKRPRFT